VERAAKERFVEIEDRAEVGGARDGKLEERKPLTFLPQ